MYCYTYYVSATALLQLVCSLHDVHDEFVPEHGGIDAVVECDVGPGSNFTPSLESPKTSATVNE